MFLTKIMLNPARRATRALVASPQAMHAAVLAGHPPSPTEPGERVLWRLDRGARHELTLYVSSPWQPEFKHLVEDAGWESSPEGWQTVDVLPFLDRLENGQRWQFRLTANPVRAVRESGAPRGRVKAHVTAQQQSDWLVDRAKGHGFTVMPNALDQPSLEVRDRRRLDFARRSDGVGRRVIVVTATFDGVLEVEDASALRQALVTGIGRAKAYGCGLLTLAPAPALAPVS